MSYLTNNKLILICIRGMPIYTNSKHCNNAIQITQKLSIKLSQIAYNPPIFHSLRRYKAMVKANMEYISSTNSTLKSPGTPEFPIKTNATFNSNQSTSVHNHIINFNLNIDDLRNSDSFSNKKYDIIGLSQVIIHFFKKNYFSF